MDLIQPPKRMIEVEIKISADDWSALTHELDEILLLIGQKKAAPGFPNVSGGPSSSHVITIKTHPEQTPEKYKIDLKEYVQNVRTKIKTHTKREE